MRGSVSLAYAQGGDVGDRSSPQKHVRRAQIVMLTADGFGTTATQAIGEMAAELAAPRPNARMSDRCDGRLNRSCADRMLAAALSAQHSARINNL
jgi:hypothetical protein